ncbi:MAG: hypothetical protein LKI53_00865 [Bacteroidales bacterium]|jgi:hypothetical protein|nr:hypothetical protein [Bacteroidales bacterium]
MDKQILLPFEVRRELSKTFRCSRNELNRALTYKVNSSHANLLRSAAIERGGLLYFGTQTPKGNSSIIRTRYDNEEGCIYQLFGDVMKLVVNLGDDCNVDVYVSDRLVASYRHVTVLQWADVLFSFEQIYNRVAIND